MLGQHGHAVCRLQYLVVSCDLSFIPPFDLFLRRTRQEQMQLNIGIFGFQLYDRFGTEHIKADRAAVIKVSHALFNQLYYSIFQPLNKFRGYFFYPMSGKTASFHTFHSSHIL